MAIMHCITVVVTNSCCLVFGLGHHLYHHQTNRDQNKVKKHWSARMKIFLYIYRRCGRRLLLLKRETGNFALLSATQSSENPLAFGIVIFNNHHKFHFLQTLILTRGGNLVNMPLLNFCCGCVLFCAPCMSESQFFAPS